MRKRFCYLAVLVMTILLSACGGDDGSPAGGTCPAKPDIDLS